MSTFMRCGLQLITLLPSTLCEMQAAKVIKSTAVMYMYRITY